MTTIRWSLLLLLLGVLTAGCQLRVGTDVVVEADGSGTFELVVALDEELTALLTDAGVELSRGLEEVEATAPSWEVEHDTSGPGQRFTFSAPFDDPEELERMVRDLHAALGPEDGHILDAVDVHRTEEGAITFEAMAGLVPPTTIGATGSTVDIDGDDVRQLLEERGEEFARFDLRLTLPAPPVASDADEQDGNTLVWHLPVGDERLVSARSAVPRDTTWLVAGGVALGAFLVAALTTVALRRRRRS